MEAWDVEIQRLSSIRQIYDLIQFQVVWNKYKLLVFQYLSAQNTSLRVFIGVYLFGEISRQFLYSFF